MGLLYNELAQQLLLNMEQGIWHPGERLPGVRALSQQRKVSVATVLSAYRQLESLGHIEARDRSGFYMRRKPASVSAPHISSPSARPTPVTGHDMMLEMVRTSADPHVAQLGAAVPDISYMPSAAIEKAITASVRQERALSNSYVAPPGYAPLRRQIARHMASFGCSVAPEEIVITNGCQEALTLALRVLTKPGDTVAVESPAYYGLLRIIDLLGLKALEIPTDPEQGMSVQALQLALENWDVKACVVIPNYNNPLGFCMPQSRRLELLNLLNMRNIPLVEDDIYGDLSHSHDRPGALKNFDKRGEVIYCSSFSKSLSPGLRLGWIVPGKYQAQVEYAKYVNNVSTSALPQLAVTRLMEGGQYERHLRDVRPRLALSVERMLDACVRHFPEGTRITRPSGGFLLWAELPEDIDTFALAQKALKEKISIAPGALFSARGKYQNFMRLSCALRENFPLEGAVATLGRLMSG